MNEGVGAAQGFETRTETTHLVRERVQLSRFLSGALKISGHHCLVERFNRSVYAGRHFLHSLR